MKMKRVPKEIILADAVCTLAQEADKAQDDNKYVPEWLLVKLNYLRGYAVAVVDDYNWLEEQKEERESDFETIISPLKDAVLNRCLGEVEEDLREE
jgi:hypothetical protein